MRFSFGRVVRPFGHLAFFVGLVLLGLAAQLLGDDHELGFFLGCIVGSMRRYPEVVRRGRQVAWAAWAFSVLYVLTPFDPISPHWGPDWDSIGLFVVGAICASWRLDVLRVARSSS